MLFVFNIFYLFLLFVDAILIIFYFYSIIIISVASSSIIIMISNAIPLSAMLIKLSLSENSISLNPSIYSLSIIDLSAEYISFVVTILCELVHFSIFSSHSMPMKMLIMNLISILKESITHIYLIASLIHLLIMKA